MFSLSPKQHFERVKNNNSSIMITWTIENASYNTCETGDSLDSDFFTFPKEIIWTLFLYPRGKDNTTDMELELKIQTVSGECDYNLNLSVLTSNKLIFTKEYRMNFDNGVTRSIGNLLKTDFLNNRLVNDTLTLQCEISPAENSERLKDEDQAHIESLSADLLNLFTSKKYYDLILIVHNEKFYVHRRILSVRWPTLAGYLNYSNYDEMPSSVTVSNVLPEVMKNLISYVYSGKVNFNISTEMLKSISKLKLLSLKEHLSEFPHSYVARTVIPVDRKTVVWNLGEVNFWDESSMPFIRVLPIEGFYIHQIVLIFSTANHDGDEFLRVEFKLPDFSDEKPVLLKCEATLYNHDRTIIACLNDQHMFVDSDKWNFPDFVKKHQVMTGKNNGSRSEQSLEIELSMSDGENAFNIEATNTELYTESRLVNDLNGLSIDFCELYDNTLTDTLCNITIWGNDGSELRVHKAILWARWPESLTALKVNDYLEVELADETMDKLIQYIYCGYMMEDLNPTEAQQILEVNKMAKLPSVLIEKCSELLNACN